MCKKVIEETWNIPCTLRAKMHCLMWGNGKSPKFVCQSTRKILFGVENIAPYNVLSMENEYINFWIRFHVFMLKSDKVINLWLKFEDYLWHLLEPIDFLTNHHQLNHIQECRPCFSAMARQNQSISYFFYE